ncbi:hypothetical protein Sjap_008309 [Stephania japonica]|uniref:Uncharacterized protein n=1 Tax=Stephania japonica TaxID=461633 RepID=A0AAP0JRI5_9MAGN
MWISTISTDEAKYSSSRDIKGTISHTKRSLLKRLKGIVVSQTITVLVGCFGTTIRFLSMAKHLLTEGIEDITSEGLCPRWWLSYIMSIILRPFIITMFFLRLLYYWSLVISLRGFWEKASESVDDGALCNFSDEPKDGIEVEDMTKECKALISSFKWESDEWAFKKGVKEMMRFMSKSKHPIHHLIQLLHKTPPSQVSLVTLLQNQRLPGSEEYQVSPLSILALAKIILLSIPRSMSQCIYDSLKDFFLAIQYIRNKGNRTTVKFGNDSFESTWSIYFGFLNNDEKPKPEEDFQSQMQLDQALKIIRDVKLKSKYLLIEKEIAMISQFIKTKAYASVEDLYQHMEQLFVDMIVELLLQLPGIVLKEIVESSLEDLEEKVKEALKVVSKFEQLRNLDALSYLGTTTTTSTTTNTATNANVEGEDIATLENNANVSVATDVDLKGIPNTQNPLEIFVEGDYESRILVSDATQDDEIIQIE